MLCMGSFVRSIAYIYHTQCEILTVSGTQRMHASSPHLRRSFFLSSSSVLSVVSPPLLGSPWKEGPPRMAVGRPSAAVGTDLKSTKGGTTMSYIVYKLMTTYGNAVAILQYSST